MDYSRPKELRAGLGCGGGFWEINHLKIYLVLVV
jgi:hypothetical protein